MFKCSNFLKYLAQVPQIGRAKKKTDAIIILLFSYYIIIIIIEVAQVDT